MTRREVQRMFDAVQRDQEQRTAEHEQVLTELGRSVTRGEWTDEGISLAPSLANVEAARVFGLVPDTTDDGSDDPTASPAPDLTYEETLAEYKSSMAEEYAAAHESMKRVHDEIVAGVRQPVGGAPEPEPVPIPSGDFGPQGSGWPDPKIDEMGLLREGMIEAVQERRVGRPLAVAQREQAQRAAERAAGIPTK